MYIAGEAEEAVSAELVVNKGTREPTLTGNRVTKLATLTRNRSRY